MKMVQRYQIQLSPWLKDYLAGDPYKEKFIDLYTIAKAIEQAQLEGAIKANTKAEQKANYNQ